MKLKKQLLDTDQLMSFENFEVCFTKDTDTVGGSDIQGIDEAFRTMNAGDQEEVLRRLLNIKGYLSRLINCLRK